jgi:hypothetical protein
MMRDPFTILQLANPITAEELPETLTATKLDERHRSIVEAPPAPLPLALRRLPRRPPYRRRRLAAAALVVAMTTVGWAIYQATREPTKPSTIVCYAAADLGSRTQVVVNDGRPPTDICADLWRRGVFGETSVPPLVACVIPSGVVGVVPSAGPDTCTAMGASSLAPSPTTTSDPSTTGSTPSTTLDPATLTEALSAQFRGLCYAEDQARELVERELAARGLGDWTVVSQGTFTAERPCATLAVGEGTVRLIPAPPPRR